MIALTLLWQGRVCHVRRAPSRCLLLPSLSLANLWTGISSQFPFFSSRQDSRGKFHITVCTFYWQALSSSLSSYDRSRSSYYTTHHLPANQLNFFSMFLWSYLSRQNIFYGAHSQKLRLKLLIIPGSGWRQLWPARWGRQEEKRDKEQKFRQVG